MEIIVLALAAWGIYYLFFKKKAPSPPKKEEQGINPAKLRVVTLEKTNLEVFKRCLKNNTLEYNAKVIDHYKLGSRIFVFPAGTVGGGYIGIVKKKDEHLVGDFITALGLEYDNGKIFITVKK